MWKGICSVFWIALIQTTTPAETNGPIPVGERTVLVYENVVANGSHQFVLRIARFKPDIFLEWESREHQGTLHLYRKAVESAKKFALSSLFDVGSDIEGADVTTKWLSREVYEKLAGGEEVKISLNRIPTRFKPGARTTRSLRLNKEDLEVTGLQFEDSRGGHWVVLTDPDNPLVLEYRTRHYRESLQSVSTDPRNYLRWIKKLPPVK